MKKEKLCGNCDSNKQVEVITGGLVQKVYREGDWILKEETEFEKTEKHSKWYCLKCNHEIK